MQKTMLIVDDSRVSRMMIRTFAAEMRPDWRFIEAASGDQALDVAATEELQLISMDFNMPGITGLEAAEKILLIRPQVVIAMLTANVQETSRSRAQALGLHFVAKPVTRNSVEQIVALLGAADD